MVSVGKKAQVSASREHTQTRLRDAVLEAAEEGRPCQENLDEHFPDINLYPEGGFNSE